MQTGSTSRHRIITLTELPAETHSRQSNGDSIPFFTSLAAVTGFGNPEQVILQERFSWVASGQGPSLCRLVPLPLR